jgi:hypothetical protein
MDSPEVHISLLITHACFTHMRFPALLQALLTMNHPLVQAYQEFTEEFTAMEPDLDRALPRNQEHCFIAPALMVRWAQLCVSYWFRRQASTNRAQPVPDLNELFNDIALDRDWAPNFPERYLKAPDTTPSMSGKPSIGDASSVVSGLTSSTGTSKATNPQGGSRTSKVNSVITKSDDVAPRFRKFKQSNLRARDVKKRAGKDPPLNTTTNCIMCPSYHFKGVCNTNCGSCANHVTHTEQEDDLLEAWGNKHWTPAGGT